METINKGFSENRPFSVSLSAMEIKTIYFAVSYNLKRAEEDLYKAQIRAEEVNNPEQYFLTPDLDTIKWRYNIARDVMEQMRNALKLTKFYDVRLDKEFKYDYFDLPKYQKKD